MQRQKVQSSNLASIGYDKENQLLEIEFNHGGVYEYFDVPNDVYEELMNASSHGKYFISEIKDSYDYNKIR
jgi:hypothetical protein